MAKSRIRRLNELTRDVETDPNAKAYSELFHKALHPQEHALFKTIMGSLEEKVDLPSELHRLDAAIAVATALIMCRLLDSGQYDALDKIAPTWNRHGKPLIAALNDRIFKKSPIRNGNALTVISRLLEKRKTGDCPPFSPPPDAAPESDETPIGCTFI